VLPAVGVALTGVLPSEGRAQDVGLPAIDVTATREIATAGLGGGIGIVGASTSVITAEEIARSPEQTLPAILSRQPGIQVRNLFGQVNGSSATVDMRGFGATGTSNTLVLVNGRRLNDSDMTGVDFSAIPLESIERVEITRGNSGAVLYGDGAVGGVINIVTKTGAGVKPSIRFKGQAGSYNYYAGNASATGSFGPLSIAAYGNYIDSGGYRENNELRQRNGVVDFRYTGSAGTAYLTLSGDTQYLGFPGARLVTATGIDQLVTDRRGATTPFDYGKKDGLNVTGGVTRNIAPGTEFIFDGGIRNKHQEAGFFNPFGDNAVDTTLTTYSLTPRIVSAYNLLGTMPSRLIAGIDYYFSDYGSDRMVRIGNPPNHRYDLNQTSLSAYAQQTVTVLPSTDVAAGGRVQYNDVKARDHFDPLAPAGFPPPQGLPFDGNEVQWAAHLGIEHRINNIFTVFGRVARSFRFPNVDERVGVAPFGVPTNFDLRTQTSHDAEAGFRVRWQQFNWQTSAYIMDLKDEIYFSPATFTNVNLDPTRRYGVENTASYQWTPDILFKAGLVYTRAVFTEGPFDGKDVPLVARWTGMLGVSWNILGPYLVFDGVARFVGPSWMDNDPRNVQPKIPERTIVDARLGGKYERVSYSISVQNLFNEMYFEYGVASAFTLGTYNAYPLPGRTVLGRLAIDLL